MADLCLASLGRTVQSTPLGMELETYVPDMFAAPILKLTFHKETWHRHLAMNFGALIFFFFWRYLQPSGNETDEDLHGWKSSFCLWFFSDLIKV